MGKNSRARWASPCASANARDTPTLGNGKSFVPPSARGALCGLPMGWDRYNLCRWTSKMEEPWLRATIKRLRKAIPLVGNNHHAEATFRTLVKSMERRLAALEIAHGVQAGQPCLTYPFAADRESSFMKAGYGKTVRPVCAADGGKLFIGRLLRPDSWEVGEQRGAPLRSSPRRSQPQRSRWSEGRGPRGMRTGKARTGLSARPACHKRRNACGNCSPFGPEVGAVCGKAARTVLCGGVR